MSYDREVETRALRRFIPELTDSWDKQLPEMEAFTLKLAGDLGVLEEVEAKAQKLADEALNRAKARHRAAEAAVYAQALAAREARGGAARKSAPDIGSLETLDDVARAFLASWYVVRAKSSRNTYVWNGRRWAQTHPEHPFENMDVSDFLLDLVKAATVAGNGELVKHFTKLRNKVAAVTKQACLMVPAQETLVWDAAEHELNVENGVLRLDTGELREHNPESSRHSRIAPARYAPGVRAPRWEAHIRHLVGGDEELYRMWQIALGAGLSARREEHILLPVIGASRTGKSTVFAVLADHVLGATHTSGYVARLPDGFFWEGSGSDWKHEQRLLRFEGARIMYEDEQQTGKFLNAARAKEVTGGSTLEARGMRENERTIRLTARIFILGNENIALRDPDDGLLRRLRTLPVEAQPVPDELRDHSLAEKLAQEASGILNWLMEGYQRWLESGKKTPEPQKARILKDSAYSTNSATEFVENYLVLDPTLKTPARIIADLTYKHAHDIRTGAKMFHESVLKEIVRRGAKRGFARMPEKTRVWEGVGIATGTHGA